MKYHMTLKSNNSKVGPIPVTTSSKETCPSTCPFNNGGGCYAASGPLAIHWSKVTKGERGGTIKELCHQVAGLPQGQLWRHNQAGDLPGVDGKIHAAELRALVKANKGKRGFTYTHKPMTMPNMKLVKEANDGGFTINLSANNMSHADELAALNVGPVVVVVPEDHPQTSFTAEGRKVVVCPEQTHGTSCVDCRLCASTRNGIIIGFRAHGSSRKRMIHIIKEG